MMALRTCRGRGRPGLLDELGSGGSGGGNISYPPGGGTLFPTNPSSPSSPIGRGGGPAACSPGNGGDVCGGSGPASLGAGNPINLTNGNKYQREVDLPPLPGVLGLEIMRHYNSAYSGANVPSGILGRGWKLSYETTLYVIGRSIQIVQADGTRLLFSREAGNESLCSSDDSAHGQVWISRGAQGSEYTG